MRPNEPHLGVDDIAKILDRKPGDIDPAAKTHLMSCVECLGNVRDMAVEVTCLDEGEFVSGGEPWDLARAGKKFAEPVDPGGRRVERPAARASWMMWRVRFAAVTVFIALMVVAGMCGVHFVESARLAHVSGDVLGPVEAAVAAFSNLGDLVIPGGEKHLTREAPVFRAVYRPVDDAFDSSLDVLLEKFRAGSSSSDVAYWLVAGYVASGNLGNARVYGEWARERFPSDARFEVLDAIVAFMDSDYARSEKLLRGVIDSHESGLLNANARVDLAVVLREQGREAEAREVLGVVMERFAGTPIADRAEALSVIAN